MTILILLLRTVDNGTVCPTTKRTQLLGGLVLPPYGLMLVKRLHPKQISFTTRFLFTTGNLDDYIWLTRQIRQMSHTISKQSNGLQHIYVHKIGHRVKCCKGAIMVTMGILATVCFEQQVDVSAFFIICSVWSHTFSSKSGFIPLLNLHIVLFYFMLGILFV